MTDRQQASARRHSGADYPAWVRELDYTLPVTPQYVVSGNIRDLHLLPESAPGFPDLASTLDVLTDLFRANGYSTVLTYDVIDGLSVLSEDVPGAAGRIVDGARPGAAIAMTLTRFGETVRRVVHSPVGPVAIIVDYGSRLQRSPSDVDQELHSQLAVAQKLANTASRPLPTPARPQGIYNVVVWMVDQEGDLPHWLTSDERVRTISIPSPTMTTRFEAAERIMPSVAAYPDDVHEGIAVVRRFAELTHGMSLLDIREIGRLAVANQTPVPRIDEAIRGYRIGITDNPWKQTRVLENIRRGAETLGVRVIGQDAAIRKSLDILMRSSIGLTGAHSGGHATRPQGVLFFAGPTGVGKTELAKSLAHLLFGTEDAYIRFDMSEFSSEQSEARLIGAPPGYVGHDAGGELTNAVRQRPFSIILFDEIEKAHPRILDKFLQILEDGRLTDGAGSTVYFSDAVIIFTSNLGVYRDEGGTRVPIVVPGMQDYETLTAKVREAIRDDFITRVGRPELLNRIGENIVVFDFITADMGRRILSKYLDNISIRLAQQRGISLTIPEHVKETVASATITPDALAFGGRGIGNSLELVFLNPLARALFEGSVAPGEVTVKSVQPTADGWEVLLG